ncbi:hypothetical protein QYE76_017411 [Lolium multiflorum]|uniref:Peptidase A1 domain-containing protein n=1 Tax=Lolium multiflorum TaxID=4521 RepID=A0AAD8QF49_LOLMU|nr:hypothetical protein QYE76_017411 [Lolium multiflorum]
MWSPIIGLLLLLLPLAPSSASYIKYPLEGNVYPTGRFVVRMNIGEPLQPYDLDIDTGSNVTWLECQHPVYGSHGSPGVKRFYKPGPANLRVYCKDPFCASLRADLPGRRPRCPRKDPHECHYKIEYVDMTTEGVLVNDTISLSEGRNEVIVFGCGYDQRLKNPSPTQPPAADGLLGLGMGKVGFVAQLKAHGVITKDVIGHCLGGSRKRGGYLFIGDYDKLPSTGMTWAPLKKYGLHYSPGQATLHLDGQQIYANGMNVVFDSGATYTYVPTQIYKPLVAKLKAILGNALDPVRHHALPNCWMRRGTVEPFDDVNRPSGILTLRFDNNIVMTLLPKNYLIPVENNIACLGILNGSDVGQNHRIIIGDATMQDMLVVYDNEQGRIGWASEQCTGSATTSRL